MGDDAGFHHFQKTVEPLVLHGIGDIVFDCRGRSSFARRIDECESSVVFDLLAQSQRIFELLIRLIGESDDDVGRDRAAGDLLANAPDQIQIRFSGIATAH